MSERTGESTGESTGDIPVACALDADGLTTRVDEWRALMASSVTALDVAPASVRLTLADDEAALVAAASLGQREKQCCPFFDVSVELGPRQRALVLSVPAGAEEALAGFAEMLRSGP